MMTFVGRNAAVGQVLSSLVEIVKSQLGTCRSVKCVIDGDEKHFDLFSCTAFLLQNLDVEHPVYNIINGVVQSQHSSHRNCSKTLLVMAGLWYLKLEELVSQGFDAFKVVKTFETGLEASIAHLMHSSAIRHLDNCPLRSGNQEIHLKSTLLSGCGDINPQSSLKDDNLSQPKPSEEVLLPVSSTDAERFIRDDDDDDDDDDVSWFFNSDPLANNETVLTKTDLIPSSSESSILEESSRKMAPQLERTSGNDGRDERELHHKGCGEERTNSGNDKDFDDCFSNITSISTSSQRNRPCVSFESSLKNDRLTANDCKLLSCTNDFVSNSSFCPQRDIARIWFAEGRVPDPDNSPGIGGLCSVESGAGAMRESGFGSRACHLMGCDALLEPDGLDDIDGINVSFSGIIGDATELEDDDDFAAGSCSSRGAAPDDPPPNRYSRHLATGSGDRSVKCPDALSVQQSPERVFAPLLSSPVQTVSSFSDEENTGVENENHPSIISCSSSSSPALGQWLTELGSKLSHGADDMMKLVVEMAHGQLVEGTSDRFDIVLIQTRCLGGVGEEQTCVVDGLLLPVDSDQISLVVEEENATERRALLVNGDLTSLYHHQGFRNDAKVTTVQKNLFAVESKYDTWLNSAISVIKQMNVRILFVRGNVDENLLYSCRCRKVVVVSGVPYSCLSALSCATDAPMSSYVVDCVESSVATGVELRLWNSTWIKHQRPNKEQHYITVQVRSSKVPLQTAIVCHPLESVAEVREEQLWHCAHRMQRVLAQRKALLGRGHAERTCAAFLDGSAENLTKCGSNQDDWEAAAVYRAMGECFTRFSDIVCKNAAKETTAEDPVADDRHDDVYDDCESKLESWRTASFLAGLLLRCDMEVVARKAKAVTTSQGLTVGFL